MKKNTILNLFVLFIVLCFISFSVYAGEFERSPRFNIKVITGDDFIGQAGILYPFQNEEDSLWFTDVRYRMSEDDVEEWNLGLGYRKKIETTENTIAGIYAYKDRREEYDHYWDMWTLGGEILTDEWDFRLNGYITEDEKVLAPFSTGSTSAYVNDSSKIVISPGKEIYYKSMNGIDIELGKRFSKTETIFNNVGIYAKLFRFFESDTPTLTGRQIRIDKQFGDRNKTTWKIGALWRDDNIRGSETEATFAVSIPFGEGSIIQPESHENPSQIVESRMTEQPERDLDIVVGESVSENTLVSEEEELAAYDSSGNELGRVWYVTALDNENTEGTEENPIDIDYLINNVLNNKVEPQNVSISREPVIESNDVIVFIGGDNKFDLRTQSLDLKYGQKLLSTGHGELDVQSDNGTIETIFRPEGERANIIGDDSIVIVNGNNIVSGFEMTGRGSNLTLINGDSIKGNININNIKFGHISEIEQGSIEIKIQSKFSAIDFNVDRDPDTEFDIEIKNNEFELSKDNNFDVVRGIEIDNNSINDANENIIISNNNFINFNSTNSSSDYAVHIWYLNTYNAPIIENNIIENTDIGIYFNEIIGDSIEDKLSNLNNLNIEYENENNISGSEHLDVFDHIINNWYDLNAVRYNLDKIHLVKSNLNSATQGYQELASDTANNGQGWNPIGKDNFRDFSGTFAGNDKIIRDIYINRNYTQNIGLFSSLSNGEIKDIGIKNIEIIGHSANSGGLVGHNKSGKIINSYSIGNIHGSENVGGLVGYNENGTIINSNAEGNISGAYFDIGGLVGDNEGNILASYSETNIEIEDNNFNDQKNVGGLVGNNSGSIEDSYSSGKLIGPEKSGGLVGNNDGTILRSYSKIDVTSDGNYIGGLVGYNNDGDPNNDYNIINSYWDTEISNQSESDGGTGLTTEEMKDSANYNNWDFVNVWDIDTSTNNGYPYLQ